MSDLSSSNPDIPSGEWNAESAASMAPSNAVVSEPTLIDPPSATGAPEGLADASRVAPTAVPPNAASAVWPTPGSSTAQFPVKPFTGGPAKRRTDWTQRGSLLLVAALVGGLAGHFSSSSTSAKPVYVIKSSNSTPTGKLLSSGKTVPALVNQVTPSVVSIDVQTPSQEDQGTGMILTSDGLILTNNHVIAAAAAGGRITVTLSGSTATIPAVLVGTVPSEDVALIRALGQSNLPTVTLGNSDALVTGDSVVAIGNALGLAAGTPSVTEGIVSALGRTVTAGDASTSQTETLHNMIQTDAAINPGNSGGPLLDAEGQVIGMNTAVAGTLPDGTSAQNIGFAIPVAEIKRLLPQLRRGGTATGRGAYLGVQISTLTPALAQSYGFSTTSGALVVAVVAGDAASAAGIRQGDIIVGIGNTTVASAADVTTAIHRYRVGQRAKIVIVRNGSHVTLYVTLGRAPA
jgi:S1-C subfamily serine protease